jgi:hypothetical protein
MSTQEDLQATAKVLEATFATEARRSSTALRYSTTELAENLSLPEDEVDQALETMATELSKVSKESDEWVIDG